LLHGWNYEWFEAIAVELEVTSNGLCRAGLAASYHPNSKTVFKRGLLLPR
jgi:hypothetical protein